MKFAGDYERFLTALVKKLGEDMPYLTEKEVTEANPNNLRLVEREEPVDFYLFYDEELTRPAAHLGLPGLSGIWQPTGDKFEVMFNSGNPPGYFYLRERE